MLWSSLTRSRLLLTRFPRFRFADSGLVLGMAILATFIFTLLLAFVVPFIYRRYKYPNYDQLRDLMAPVDS